MAGTWTALCNLPPDPVCTTLLLTDGSVLAQGVSTNNWYRFFPNGSGSYVDGSWSNAASSTNGPLYYASGILRDGRVIVAGGEYNFGAMVWLKAVELYDPVSDSWSNGPTPPGWVRIGDAPGCVLPDGRFFLGQVSTFDTAIYDPVADAWTAAANKLALVGEESWSLLQDGTVHAVDCSNPPNAEKYIIAAEQWVGAGSTPQTLVDSISEIGASALLPDGRLFVIGATGASAIYTVPPVANQAGTWQNGPTIPPVNAGEALGTVDAPAAILPNGRVLFTAGPITTPASFQPPTYFFEYDPATNSMSAVPRPTNSGRQPYWGRMLMLPSGQVMYTDGTGQAELYTPDGAPELVWKPTITGCPATVRRGWTHTLYGRQLNGLTQCVYYGNDATQATNYPIVRLESTTTSQVVYCRTHTFSTMGLQTGTVIHSCRFHVPSSTPLGCYRLRVIANGIASDSREVCVTNKLWKELKLEIKEKNEIVEVNKRVLDIAQKRIPDIDLKGVREDVVDIREVQEEWLSMARKMASQIDEAQTFMRTFIKPEERPEVGPTEPEIRKVLPRKISKAQAERDSIKEAFADPNRAVTVTADAEAFRQKVHSLSRGGKANVLAEQRGGASKKPATRKAGKTSRRKKSGKKATKKVRRRKRE